MPDVTEGTINNLMGDYLRANGVSVSAEISAQTRAGRRQPDFELHRGGDFYCEGEWISSYLDGYHQAMEYGDIPGASGYFVIGYPDELKTELKQTRLNDDPDPAVLLSGVTYRGMFKLKGEKPALYRGDLEGIPSWIEDALSEGEQREDSEEYTRLMRELVNGLTDYIPEAEEYPSMFEHIIADMPQEKTEFSAAKNAAAYLLLNQVVFYRILHDHGFPRLDPDSIAQPSDLRTQYFEEVLDVNYEAIFALNVVDLVPPGAVEHLRSMIRIVNDLKPEEFTRDLLGSAFHELIPLEVRKPVAAYYTNPMAARLLAKLSVESADDTVADFACGSGTLLMAGYEEKQEQLRGSLTEDVHREFVEEEITGLDIMPFAAHLAAVQLGLRNPGYLTDRPRIAIRDSTTIQPETVISSLQQELPSGQSSITQEWTNTDEETIGQGAISSAGEGSEFEVNPVDVVLMNPPFTRKQHITPQFRSMLQSRFSDYGDHLDAEMGFYAYFVLLADRFIKPGGRIAMVLPSVILQQQTVAGIRQVLQNHYDVEHIVLSQYRSAFSEDTSLRESLLVLRKYDQADDRTPAPARVASLETLPDRSNIDTLAAALLSSHSTNAADQDELLELVEVPQQEFKDTLNWMSVVREYAGFYYEHPNTSRFAPLGDEVETIIGGIRYNDSSDKVHPVDTMLSRDRGVDVRVDWAVDSETDEAFTVTSQHTGMTVDVPRDAVGEGLRSLSGVRRLGVSDAPDKIVLDRFKDDDLFWETDTPTELLSRRKKHVSSRLCRLVVGGYGNLDLGAGGTSFVAIAGEEPIAPTWSMWSVQPESSAQAKILALWFNSTYSVAKMVLERNEVRGTVMKWRKTDLQSLPVVSISKLTDDEKDQLLGLYDDVAGIEFPSLTEQLDDHFEARTKIDRMWATILGWDEYLSDEDEGIHRLQEQLGGFLGELQMLMEND